MQRSVVRCIIFALHCSLSNPTVASFLMNNMTSSVCQVETIIRGSSTDSEYLNPSVIHVTSQLITTHCTSFSHLHLLHTSQQKKTLSTSLPLLTSTHQSQHKTQHTLNSPALTTPSLPPSPIHPIGPRIALRRVLSTGPPLGPIGLQCWETRPRL